MALQIKATITGTIEKRLKLERERTGLDTASIVRVALDQHLRSFEFYEREGLKDEGEEPTKEES